MNAIEKAAIAKSVATYIIDHLLVEEPMSATELERLAVDITEDKGITDAGEFADITRFAVNYVSSDPRVKVESKSSALWITHK